MKKQVVRFHLALLASFSLLPAVDAGSLPSLIASVDVVVYASAVRNGAVVTFSPKRVFKGEIRDGAQAPWYSGNIGISGGTATANTASAHGLWFLERVAEGGYRIVPARGLTVVWERTYFRLDPNLAPQLKVPAASLADEILLQIAQGEVTDDSPFSINQTYEAASDLQTPAATAALKYLSNFERNRPAALAGLIDRDDEEAFQTFARDIHKYDEFALANFASVIYASFRSTKPEIIDLLGALTFGSDTPDLIRPAAAQALRSIHTRETLPYLSRMLDSGDVDMRQKAVFGFSGFANGLPMQKPEDVRSGRALVPSEQAQYRTEDTMRYFALPLGLTYDQQEPAVKFWSGWWQTHRAELGF